MPADAERLLRNRFPEFQRLAQDKGTLSKDGVTQATKGPRTSFNASPGKSAFMVEFFASIGEIQGVLNSGKANVKTLGQVLEESLQATTQEKERAASERFHSLVQETQKLLTGAKNGLEEVVKKSENRDSTAAEAKIRANMQRAMIKKHQQLLLDFQQAQLNFKKALEQRQAREMQILMPECTEDERASMIEQGDTSTLIITQKMAGAHAALLDEVQRVRDKHKDILMLERSMEDLLKMFQEMACLVDAQGEMLDAIEQNVHQTKECTAKAEKNLIKTRKAQHSAQRKMCWMTVICVLLLLVILGPVLISKG